ncbi:trichome birefringence-like protein 3, partial [Tanacetum coccineum]
MESIDDTAKTTQTLRSCLKATKIRSIDGKILGRNGQPLIPVRQVQFGGAKPAKSSVEERDTLSLNETELPTTYDTNSSPKSFASVLHGSMSECAAAKVNFRKMSSPDVVENTDFVLPIASVQAVQHKFENSVVGFFVGKKVAFTIVKNYVTNTWAKFGFEKIMSDDDGLFYFKFSSGKGVEQVIEQGPWLIRNVPLILTKWSPNMSLSKDEVTRVPVWVKLHKVPVVAYSADGLSLIASQIGNPIMLDAFTSAMCVEAWGRIGYARALIEVCADKELKQEVVMAIPKGEEVKDGHSVAKIRVEYEWKPPVCIDCKVFGHTAEQCPKKVVVQPSTAVVVDGDGFTTVVNRKSKGKGAVSWQKKNVGGFKVNNAKNFVYQPVKPKENASKPSTSGLQKAGMESSKEEATNGI